MVAWMHLTKAPPLRRIMCPTPFRRQRNGLPRSRSSTKLGFSYSLMAAALPASSRESSDARTLCERSKFAMKTWAITVALTLVLPTLSQAAPAETDMDRIVSRSERRELLTCWTDSAVLYAGKTCEPADMIVNAAFGKCLQREKQLRDAVVARAPYMGRPYLSGGSGVESLIEGFRHGARPIMLSAILDKRVELGLCARTK
jgi:hypothetical protein